MNIQYNPDTGTLSRGGVNTQGYWQVRISGKLYLGHRLAWFLAFGKWPTEIDHINGDRADNRLVNLREVERVDNTRNRKTPCTNTSGVMGVSWDAANSKWQAAIWVDGKSIKLGRHKNFGEACAARKAGEIKYGFHKNHGRDQ